MSKQFAILNNLTVSQRKEFDKDLQELYKMCISAPGFPMASRNEATVNMNLLDEIYLNVTIDFENPITDKVKGRILELYQYKDKNEYDVAVSKENRT